MCCGTRATSVAYNNVSLRNIHEKDLRCFGGLVVMSRANQLKCCLLICGVFDFSSELPRGTELTSSFIFESLYLPKLVSNSSHYSQTLFKVVTSVGPLLSLCAVLVGKEGSRARREMCERNVKVCNWARLE